VQLSVASSAFERLNSAVPCNDNTAALSVFMRFACSAACCDPAQSVAVCLNLMDSQAQQHIAASPVFSCDMQC